MLSVNPKNTDKLRLDQEVREIQAALKLAKNREQLAPGNLKRMAETLKITSETVTATGSVWENVKPLLMQSPNWLGGAQNFFNFSRTSL